MQVDGSVCGCIALLLIFVVTVALLSSFRPEPFKSANKSVDDESKPSPAPVPRNDDVETRQVSKNGNEEPSLEDFYNPVVEKFTTVSGDQLFTTNSSGNFVSVDPTTNLFYCDGSSTCTQPYTATSLKVGTWTLTDTSGNLTFTSSASSASTKPYLSTSSAGEVRTTATSGTIVGSLFLGDNVTTATNGTVSWSNTYFGGSDTDYVPVVTFTYTPKSTSSTLYIHFDAMYTVGGYGGDSMNSSITVDGTKYAQRTQVWSNNTGGGTRSGVLYPIEVVVSNSTTSTRTIVIKLWNGTGDYLSFTGSYTFTVLERAT